MLQKLGDHIVACRDRANTCIAASTTETDARIRTQLLELAQQWEHVAKTYEFVASLECFLIDQQNNTLPTELGALPKDEPINRSSDWHAATVLLDGGAKGGRIALSLAEHRSK
jgi:hypothetical protein